LVKGEWGDFSYKKRTNTVGSLFWFIKNIVVAVFSVFFLTFGITNLKNAYMLKNPLEFVMIFFSASLMIMISAVGIIYAILQTYFFLKEKRGSKKYE
jgi:hypothetical protein